jgi:hypothetical protein
VENKSGKKVNIVVVVLAAALVILGALAFCGIFTAVRLQQNARSASVALTQNEALTETLYEYLEEEPMLYGRELVNHIKDSETEFVIIGDYLYYISEAHYLYQINLTTYYNLRYLQTPIFAVTTYEEALIFIAGTPPDSRIFSLDTQEGAINTIAYDVCEKSGIYIQNGVIFYTDIYGEERAVLPCGRPVTI